MRLKVEDHNKLYKLNVAIGRAVKDADLEGELILTLNLKFPYSLLKPFIQKVVNMMLDKIGLNIKIKIN